MILYKNIKIENGHNNTLFDGYFHNKLSGRVQE